MSNDVELTVDADDAQAQRAIVGVRRAIITALARDKWNRTHCTHFLAAAGRGVAHDPACNPRPVRGIRWSEAAREGLGR